MKLQYSVYVIIFTLIVFTPLIPVIAQAPDTLWTKTYESQFGVYGSNGTYVQQTEDNGYIIIGTTRVGLDSISGWAFHPDALLMIKTNSEGDTEWTQTYGASHTTVGNSGIQTSDGGYLITGRIWPDTSDATRLIWLLKTDSKGDSLWSRTFRHQSSAAKGFSIKPTKDEGYIIAGDIAHTNDNGDYWRDIWLVKINKDGVVVWEKNINKGNQSIWSGRDIHNTSDDGYIVTGSATPPFPELGGADVLLLRTNNSGDTLWTKTFGGGKRDVGYSVQQTVDGGFILTGYTESFGSEKGDLWLLRTDAHGDTLWTKTLGGPSYDGGYSIQKTHDQGFIITGYFSPQGMNPDLWLIKIDSTGNIQWTKTLGDNGYLTDIGRFVNNTHDNGYIITGSTSTHSSLPDNAVGVWLIKIEPDTGFISGITPYERIPSNFILDQNHPNPFNPITIINYQLPMINEVQLVIYNLIGQKVATLVSEKQEAGHHQVEWDASGLATGIYYYQLKSGEFQDVKKMILLK